MSDPASSATPPDSPPALTPPARDSEPAAEPPERAEPKRAEPSDAEAEPERQNEALLVGRGVTRTFFVGDEALTVVRGVDLEIRRGEMLMILGASGAGKSTLLHMLGLLDQPTAGTIHFAGRNLAAINIEAQSAVRNERFGFIFQFYHLLPEFTALDNVLMPARIRFGPFAYLKRRRKLTQHALALLGRVGLAFPHDRQLDRTRHRPHQLSGGQKQRVAIARALMNAPDIVFCDEPTGNLDSVTAASVLALIVELNRESGQTFVIVTHNEQVSLAGSRQLWMHDGRLYADRTEYNAVCLAARQAVAAATV